MKQTKHREDDTLVNRVVGLFINKPEIRDTSATKIDPKTLPNVDSMWKDDNAIASTKDVFKIETNILEQLTKRLTDLAAAQKHNNGRQLDSFMATLMGRIDESLNGNEKVVLQELSALRRTILEMRALWQADNEASAGRLTAIESKLGELYLEDS
jgi:hypothetical protein